MSIFDEEARTTALKDIIFAWDQYRSWGKRDYELPESLKVATQTHPEAVKDMLERIIKKDSHTEYEQGEK